MQEEFIVRILFQGRDNVDEYHHCEGRQAVGDVLERYESEGPNDARVEKMEVYTLNRRRVPQRAWKDEPIS